jgi:PKHD-type hydroxylase
MLVQVRNVLSREAVSAMRVRLADAPWEDGRLTAGLQSAPVKDNLQLPHDGTLARALSDEVLRALERSARFISAALPHRVFPPLFNCYQDGMGFGTHIDNAVRQIPGTPHRLRTDLSATLFLSEPQDYDGGELVVEDTYGTHSIRLAAGDMVVYPASSRHRVSPVSRGARLAAFFWVQSMVADDAERTLLFELDSSIRELTASGADADTLVRLTACYHNLLRRWVRL